MNIKVLTLVMFLAASVAFISCRTQVDLKLESPDKNIVVSVVNDDAGQVFYSVDFKGKSHAGR